MTTAAATLVDSALLPLQWSAFPAMAASIVLVFLGLLHLGIAAYRSEPLHRWFGAFGLVAGFVRIARWAIQDGGWPAPPHWASYETVLDAVWAVCLARSVAIVLGDDRTLNRWILPIALVVVHLVPVDHGRAVAQVLVAGLAFVAVARSLVQAERRALPGARLLAAGVTAFLVHVFVWAGGRLGWLNSSALLSEVLTAVGELALPVGITAALAAQFVASAKALESAHQASRRFVPFELLNILGRREVEEVSNGDAVRREMTVMFCDLRDSTSLATNQTPEETLGQMNAFHAALEPAVRAHGGVVEQHLGDGALILFPGTADDAVAASVAMAEALNAHNLTRSHAGLVPLTMGIGMHTGPVVVGVVGGGARAEVVATGATVHIAARVESLTKASGARVLLSGSTLAAMKDPTQFAFRTLRSMTPRGTREAIDIVRLLDAEPAHRKTHLELATGLWNSEDVAGPRLAV